MIGQPSLLKHKDVQQLKVILLSIIHLQKLLIFRTSEKCAPF